jgi:CheY-like chemotaxis protein
MKLAGLSLANGGVTSVDYAVNGHVALSMMKQRSYDVVVIDMHMPVMDGFEAVRLYRDYERLMFCDGISNRSFSAISEDSDDGMNDSCVSSSPYMASNVISPSPSSFPMMAVSGGAERRSGRRLMIIGMSQDCDDSIRRRALMSGADHFLPKPFTVQKLVAAVLQSRAEEFRGLESLRDDCRELESLQEDLGSSSTMVQAAEPTMP